MAAAAPELVARVLPGAVPVSMQIYDSYAVDPQWQRKFTIIWTSVLAFTTLASIPWVIHAVRTRRLYAGVAITEELEPSRSTSPKRPVHPEPPLNTRVAQPGPLARFGTATWAVWQSATLFTLPMPSVRMWKSQVADCCRRSYFSLGVGQLLLVAGYLAAAIACFTVGAQLKENPNRPGFIALAQLPVVVLLSMKSPLPLPVFLPSLSYEHYNFIHRWAGRTTWLAATVHGSMWTHYFLTTPGQKSQLSTDKAKRGLVSYAMLCMLVVTSLKPVRRLCYQLFWAAHIMFFVGFFAAIAYHTPYSRPWIFPCVAFYAYDHFVRLLRYRLKDATIVPVDPTMTMIHIPDCDAGWLPTQHVNLRVLKGAGIFEAHPFTITNAPSSGLSGSPRGIILYAKVAGDWTRNLHTLASNISLEIGDDYDEREAFLKVNKDGQLDLADHPGRQVTVMIDGPYGGLKMDLGQYETVLVVAGGSGVTFLLGTIEEALSRREKGHGPRKIDVAWVVRDLFTIEALAPTLARLDGIAASLDVEFNLSLYLTDPPFPLPPCPALLPANTTLQPYRPEIAQLVREALPKCAYDTQETETHSGLAVVAAGPEGLVMEARNAVAGISVAARVRSGGIGFHDEVYCL